MKVQLPILASIFAGSFTHRAGASEYSPSKLRPRKLGSTLTTGSNTVDFPPLSTSITSTGDLEGAQLTLQCGGTQGTLAATFTQDGFNVLGATFEDASGSAIGTVEYKFSGSTWHTSMQLDLYMVGSCQDKKLTIDLRPTCGIEEEITVVTFDILSEAQHASTPNSGSGLLDVWGGGCESNVPVFGDYAVGINGAAPVGDLWQSLTFDFGAAGCTLESDLFMQIDSDETRALGSEFSCRQQVDDTCDFCSLACNASGEYTTNFNGLEVQCCIGKEECNENPLLGLGVDVVCCSGEKACYQSETTLPPEGVCCNSLEACYQTDFQTPEDGATSTPIKIQCEGEKACFQTDYSDADDQKVDLSCVGKEACYQVGKDGKGPSDGSVVECDGEKACYEGDI